ncbi:MAG: adenylate/guanylate cyclase domain-containing protein, partial [Bacteroidota bacterium]
YLNEMTLGYDDNMFKLELSSLNYSNITSSEYQYQLQGLSDNWINNKTDRNITITNLSPGNYTLRLKAANEDGVWSTQPTEIKIKVLPPWWRTYWAYALYSAAIFGALYLYIRGLRQKVKTKQAQLEKEKTYNEELSALNQANQKFVPQGFLEILGKKSIKELRLGDQTERQMTVLFSDIRSYTSLSETMTPEENFNFINAYLGRVGPVIKAHGGFISQYFGDGLMALFLDDHQAAVRAAIAIQEELRKYNVERVAMEREPLRTGIGLNTGKLMLGIIGDVDRYDSTVISDAVNTASRMEGLTKVFGGSIILSEKTLAELPETQKLRYRYLGMVKVKGKDVALKIYDCYEGDGAAQRALKDKTKVKFEDGITYYFNRQFGKAGDCFKEVLALN